jgi:endonuclease/exonuclease/phosphatase family metal-dependent hydrolase
MTFNIQHGIDGTSRFNLQRAIDTIARVQPDVVGLQEVTRNHPYYACGDQPALIASGVRAATGQLWDVVYEQEWFTPDVSCQAGGQGTGPETEGLVLLTRRSMSAPASILLPDSRIGLQVGIRDVYGLPVAVTHLTSGNSKGSTRSQQIDRLLSWARGFGEPRILLGDFNAFQDDAELQPVMAVYRDAWTEAGKVGRAIGNAATHGSGRVDYIFYLPGTSLTLESAEVVNTRALIGVPASDHEPVVATFTVR